MKDPANDWLYLENDRNGMNLLMIKYKQRGWWAIKS